ncbi:MAG: cell division protein FtsQ/DivIB [Lachnospiraceae bacterium]|nr:cell division protein FtsQ/DivIB [Lachnospiraceae bacterium]
MARSRRSKKKGRSNIIEGRTEARHRTRLRFYVINVILGVLIFLVAAFLLVFTLFPYEGYRVEGNTYYEDNVYETMLITDDYSINTIYIKLKTLFIKPEIPEFVEKIDIGIENRKTMLVTVTEKTWTGYCTDVNGKYVYFDGDGNVVEVSERLIEGKPVVYGLVVEDAKVGEPLPVESTVKRNLVQLQNYFSIEQITYDIISFNEDGTITVFINGGNIELSIGTSNLLREKIRRLPYILPQIEGMTGVLHLEDWTKDSTDIVFEKR